MKQNDRFKLTCSRLSLWLLQAIPNKEYYSLNKCKTYKDGLAHPHVTWKL